MDRRQTILGLAAAGSLMGSQVRAATPAGANDKVGRLAELYAAAWNASDMDAMAKLYTSNVHWVNIVGVHWQGKAQVDHAHRVYFDLMSKGVPLALEAIGAVVALPGSAFVAAIRWTVGAFKTPFGQQVPPSRDRMSLVLIPAGDGLVIAHGSNVQIDEMAQRSEHIMATQPTERPVTLLRQRMLDDMAMRRMGARTRHDYVRHVRGFAAFWGARPTERLPMMCGASSFTSANTVLASRRKADGFRSRAASRSPRYARHSENGHADPWEIHLSRR